MSQSVQCPCGVSVTVTPADIGRGVRCPGCGAGYVVAAAPPRRGVRPRTPVFTYAAVGLNVGVFLAMAFSGAAEPTTESRLAWGALYGPKVGAGEWWRVLTATVLHGGLIHLIFNMLALFNLGQAVEGLLGRRATAAVYLLAAVGGSLCSLAYDPAVVSVGASGAVFGLAGGFAGLVARMWRRLDADGRARLKGPVFYGLAANLAVGFVIPGVDNAAHVGGLLVGLAAGLAIGVRPGGPTTRRLVLVVAGLGLVLAVSAVVVLTGLRGLSDWRTDLPALEKLEKRAVAIRSSAADEARAGRLTDAGFAERLDRDAVPVWRQASELADRLTVPRGMRPTVGRWREYLRARSAATAALAAAVRAGDADGVRAAVELERDADRLAEAVHPGR